MTVPLLTATAAVRCPDCGRLMEPQGFPHFQVCHACDKGWNVNYEPYQLYYEGKGRGRGYMVRSEEDPMRMDQPLTEQETIATILVNQRIMRNGSPPIVNALELLPQKLRDEVMDDAKAIIDGLAASRIHG